MGVVYRARHKQLNRHRGDQGPQPGLMATPEARRRLSGKFRFWEACTIWNRDGKPMPDESKVPRTCHWSWSTASISARIVRQGGPLSVAEACTARTADGEALAAAHRRRPFHRDVKPST